MFRWNVLLPFSGPEIMQNIQRAEVRSAQIVIFSAHVLLVGCLAYSSILKMEAVLSSETSVNYMTTWRHISYDNTLHAI
jgi:hypothetical protein